MKSLSLPAGSNFDFNSYVSDFKGLDPKDVGAWPPGPRITILLIVFVLLLVAGWWFDWRHQIEEYEKKQQEEIKLKDEWLGKKKQAVNLEEYRKQLAEIDRSFGALLRQLPNKAEMESLLVDINQAGLGRGLQFELFRPGTEIMKDFYAELPITVRVTGNYHDLGAFAGDVAKMPRIVTLNNVNVNVGKESGLYMDATATTYRYLDEEELAKQRREKVAKAKAGGK
ncbi:MAG: Pilus assembly protein PilO [Proteobacteria bacterium]|jgi:type IV pilus assembly protein PilO|nr:Pilus assembly protein PilO [Pseudomonadota bacterium]